LIEKQEESIAMQKELITSYARFVPEQLLTFLGKDIITKVGLGDNVPKDMTILFLDTVKVKGKNKAFHILEILNGVSPRIR
jgi:hypothetical protein